MGGNNPATSAKTDTSLVQNQNSGVWAALKDLLRLDFKAAAEAITPSTKDLARDMGPKKDLATDQSLPVSAVRDNSGLLGQATRSLINHNRDIDAAIDAASGGAPTPPKGPGM